MLSKEKSWGQHPKPTTGCLSQQLPHMLLEIYQQQRNAWNKKNVPALGLIQGMTSLALWPDFVSYGKASVLWTALETTFRKVGGAATYLQLVKMVEIQFTDSMDLLPQIQDFQENYTWIESNSHSQLSEDLTTFLFCSCLPNSYKTTAWQYFNNITSIVKFRTQ